MTARSIRKAIILAGGHGNRLFPATRALSKQLLNVHDKPMIYYPLSVLMNMDVRDIQIIVNASDAENFRRLLGDGGQIGLNITYRSEEEPRGIANAFIIGKDFIGSESVALILGDNVFCGISVLETASTQFSGGATTFGVRVNDAGEYGVAEIGAGGRVLSIEEKPQNPKSNIAVTGLYLYDANVVEIAASLKPSARGELEITDVNRAYLDRGQLHLHLLGGDTTWFDTGTAESMARAGNYIASLEKSTGHKVGCLEEIAYNRGFITEREFRELADLMPTCEYRDYLLRRL
ncbi:MAG: glucose-1-phosphate thymidylyltransferase RfbA [Candidatus Zixiibacteriota bacterium]|nr:MAG: glucose-1-phosphate thymidylyltransferase RfbA [candidate division Zixibacteria bacterium]